MAFRDADIEVMKAAVPSQHRPRPDHFNLLSSSYYDAADAVASAAPASQSIEHDGASSADPLTDDHAREMAGLALADDPEASASFMLTGAQASMQTNGEGNEQKKRERERTTHDLLMDSLNRRLAQLDAELVQLDKRLDEIRQRRIELGDGMEALDELERLAANGQLDPNNPAHAALLRRAGIDPEKARREDMNDIIAQRRRDMGREDDALEGEWNVKMKRRGHVASEREKVRTARAEIESASTPEAMEKAELRAQTVLGSQQLGEAAYQTESQEAKEVAADAVGISAKSEDYNRNAASLDEKIVITMDDSGPKF